MRSNSTTVVHQISVWGSPTASDIKHRGHQFLSKFDWTGPRTKARLASVDLEHLEKAEEKLKVMRKQRMHVAAGEGWLHHDTVFFLGWGGVLFKLLGTWWLSVTPRHAVAADCSSRPGCSKDELRRQMSWDLITRPSGTDTDRPCPVADCPCNETCNPGPMLEVWSSWGGSSHVQICRVYRFISVSCCRKSSCWHCIISQWGRSISEYIYILYIDICMGYTHTHCENSRWIWI